MNPRRIVISAAACLALFFGGAQVAVAWNNGGIADGEYGNGYGTHDWVLEHAIELAGESASWIDTGTALRASDDPDTRGTSTYLHVFKERGAARGAPQQAADEYHALLTAYQAGDYAEASRLLGIMSHYYSDAMVPFHTVFDGGATYRGQLVSSIHDLYETEVSKQTRTYDRSPDLFVARGRIAVTDVRARCVTAARYSRFRYSSLLSAFSVSRSVTASDPVSRQVTREALSRAVNDIADIICAIPSGTGRAQPPAAMRQVMMRTTYRYPRRGQLVRSQALCLDAAGKPMEGVKVKFTWPAPNGRTRTGIGYSDHYGLAYDWERVDPGYTMRPVPVTAVSESSGAVTRSHTWVMCTPVLAAGKSGLKMGLTDATPAQRSTVKALVLVRSTTGGRVSGIPVVFTWRLSGRTVRVRVLTNRFGWASSARNIGNATKGRESTVRATVYAGGYCRTTSQTYTPH